MSVFFRHCSSRQQPAAENALGICHVVRHVDSMLRDGQSAIVGATRGWCDVSAWLVVLGVLVRSEALRSTVKAVVLGARWAIGCLVCNLRGGGAAAALASGSLQTPQTAGAMSASSSNLRGVAGAFRRLAASMPDLLRSWQHGRDAESLLAVPRFRCVGLRTSGATGPSGSEVPRLFRLARDGVEPGR